jgi:hypothetical protein
LLHVEDALVAGGSFDCTGRLENEHESILTIATENHFSSCGFKEGNPSPGAGSHQEQEAASLVRVFWQVSDLALETAVRKLVYSAEAWAFALIHSDLATRNVVMHSRDKRTEKSCERATRMSSNIVSQATS